MEWVQGVTTLDVAVRTGDFWILSYPSAAAKVEDLDAQDFLALYVLVSAHPTQGGPHATHM